MDMDCACISPDEIPLFSGRGQPASFRWAPVQPPNKLYDFTTDEVSNFWFALRSRLLDWAKLLPLATMDPELRRETTPGEVLHRRALYRWLKDDVTKTELHWRAEFPELDDVPQLSTIQDEIG